MEGSLGVGILNTVVGIFVALTLQGKVLVIILEIRWYHVKRPLLGAFFVYRRCCMHKDVPMIETSRCILRGMEEEDISDIYAYISLPEVVRYLRMDVEKDIDDVFLYIQDVYLQYQQQNQPQCWCIEHLDSGKVIGQVCFYDEVDQQAYIECILHPTYWNQGYMSEVLLAVLHVGFAQFMYHTMLVKVKSDHAIMQHLLSKFGFHIQDVRLPNTRYRIYELTKKDWRSIYEGIKGEI